MSIEADIFTSLSSLVSARVYPDAAPEYAVKPYIVYQQIGGLPVNFLSGIPDKRNGRFQVAAWATTRIEASALIRQIEDALRLNTTIVARSENGAVAVNDPDTKLRGARQDFSIWFAA